MKHRNNILLWGSGLPGMVEKFSPRKLYKESSAWANTCKSLKPWLPISLISEGQKTRCWMSRDAEIENGLIIVGSCSSCLDVAWHFYKRGLLPIFHSVVTVRQWAGRGQLARIWYSPTGNLYGAWRLYLPDNRVWEEIISLVMGYVVVKVLIELGIGAQLKWPNDLVINRKKVGGILIEQIDGALIAGIGINLTSNPDRNSLRDTDVLSTTCLREHGVEISPLEFWLKLTKYGKSLYERIIQLEVPLAAISLIEKHLAFVGERIKVYDGVNRSFQARLLGVDSSGYLRVMTSQTERLIRCGSISVI